jgi:1,4-dihydroxy-6-naphthoate synthase
MNTPPTIPHSSPSLTFGLTPTADAAFRFHALFDAANNSASAALPSLIPVRHDIDMLDHLAHTGDLAVTLLSVPAYAYVQDRYRLLGCGARFGRGYGAMVVTYNPLEPVDLRRVSIGVPGLRNSGFLSLALFFAPETFQYTLIADDELREAVVRGDVDAALLTGEEQLTHQALGLYNVVDLGAWWQERTGLPLPLEVCAVRRDVPLDTQRALAHAVQDSIRAGLAAPAAALEAAHSYARKMDRETTATYVGMYVSESAIDMDADSRRGLQMFLEQCAQYALLPAVTDLEILE